MPATFLREPAQAGVVHQLRSANGKVCDRTHSACTGAHQRTEKAERAKFSITFLNPSPRFDSNHSLDRVPEFIDTVAMEPGDDLLLLKRVDPVRNMNRFYHLSVEPTLFGGFGVRRIWGRVGTRGRSRLDLFADAPSALAHRQQLAAQKHRRGYRPE